MFIGPRDSTAIGWKKWVFSRADDYYYYYLIIIIIIIIINNIFSSSFSSSSSSSSSFLVNVCLLLLSGILLPSNILGIYATVSTLKSRVSNFVESSSPKFCHWCILGHRWPDYVFGSEVLTQKRNQVICSQKVKVQGHTIAAEAHSTRRYLRVQLFLVGVCCSLQDTFWRYFMQILSYCTMKPHLIRLSPLNRIANTKLIKLIESNRSNDNLSFNSLLTLTYTCGTYVSSKLN